MTAAEEADLAMRVTKLERALREIREGLEELLAELRRPREPVEADWPFPRAPGQRGRGPFYLRRSGRRIRALGFARRDEAST